MISIAVRNLVHLMVRGLKNLPIFTNVKLDVLVWHHLRDVQRAACYCACSKCKVATGLRGTFIAGWTCPWLNTVTREGLFIERVAGSTIRTRCSRTWIS